MMRILSRKSYHRRQYLDIREQDLYSGVVAPEYARKQLVRRSSGRLALAVIALGACTTLWTEIFLYSQNTLFTSDRWIVAKRMAGVGIAEGDGLLLTRYALAGNVLRLGAWGGFQEVVSRFSEPFESAMFRFRIPADSGLSFTFNRTPQETQGFLLRPSGRESAFYRATRGGKILARIPIRGLSLETGWHEARVARGANDWMLAVDGRPVGNPPWGSRLSAPIAFWGEERGADVSEVKLEGPAGGWAENFRNTRNALPAALSCLALLLLVSSVRYRTFVDNLIDLSAIGLLAGAIWLPFDYFYLSRVPSQEQVLASLDLYGGEFPRAGLEIPTAAHNPSERARIRFFETWNRLVGGEAVTLQAFSKRGYPVSRTWSGPIYCGPLSRDLCKEVDASFMKELVSRPKAGLRVVYVGSSQMIGAGASTLDDTPVAKIHRALENATGRPVESLNLSMSGETANEMFDKYRRDYKEIRPDLMVICLGGTDNDEWAPYANGLEKFLELNRAQRTRSAVVFQPMLERITGNPKSLDPRAFSYRYQKARELARRYDAPVLALNEFLADPRTREQGFLWQGIAHQTPFAQDLTADWLAPRVLAALPGGRSNGKVAVYPAGNAL